MDDLAVVHPAEREFGLSVVRAVIQAEDPAATIISECVLDGADDSVAGELAAVAGDAQLTQLCKKPCSRRAERTGIAAVTAHAIELTMHERAHVPSGFARPIELRLFLVGPLDGYRRWQI